MRCDSADQFTAYSVKDSGGFPLICQPLELRVEAIVACGQHVPHPRRLSTEEGSKRQAGRFAAPG